ncbi:23 kDa integral membrane protein [Hydra vulgaris]|uniref:23 kDa integral membrane protein n=1 Tax=Hydra vulgaris TaxID=6087 RepID=UPI0001926004|nr:23 kDa integral membrane protein [Hydra vulgaris]
MVEGKMNVIKYLMFFFNFLFWLSGLALIIVGGIIKNNYGDYFSYADSKFTTAPVFIIAVGVIVFVIGFLGCCGAIKENYCMVMVFSVLLGLIFILEIVAGILGFIYKNKVQEYAVDGLKRAVKEYENKDEPGASELLDWAQLKFECCGANGPSDYKNLTKNETCGTTQGVKTCHKNKDCAKKLNNEGCKSKFEQFIKKNLVVVGVIALSIAFIQLLGIVFACYLMKAIKGEYEVV